MDIVDKNCKKEVINGTFAQPFQHQELDQIILLSRSNFVMDIDSSSDIDDYVPTKSFNGVKRSPVKSADVSMADGDGDQSIISLRRQISEISKRLKDLRSDDDIGVPRTDIVEDVLHDGSDLIMSNRSNRSRHISTVNDKRSSTVRGVPELSDIDADADVAPPISRTGTARNRNISKRSMISSNINNDISIDSTYSAVDDDNATAERLRSQLRKASKAVHQYKVVCTSIYMHC